MVNPTTGEQRSVAPEAVVEAQRLGFHPESEAEAIVTGSRDRRLAPLDNVGGQVLAGAAGLARAFTGGGSDLLLRGIGQDGFFGDLREAHPIVSGVTEAAGSFLPVGVGGMASRLGSRIAKTAEGASLGTRVARGAAGYGTEGGLQGLSSGVSEIALSDDELSVERMTSVLTSNVLFGGGVGAAAGTIGKLAESGLLRAKGHLDDIAASSRAGSDITGDVAGMDAKALRGAEKVELEAIEKARVPQRAEVANEIAALRKDMKEQKVWLATKDAKAWEGVDDAFKKEIREVGKVSLEADQALDRMLRNPKALASRPQRALDALQQQERGLERLAAQRDNLAGVFAKDTSGERMAALDHASKALERNRAVQQRLGELASAPASERLGAVRDAITTGGGASASAPDGIGQRVVQGAVYSAGAAIASSIPLLGQIPGFAAIAGAAASRLVGGKLTGRLARASSEVAERTSKAIDSFLDVSGKHAPKVPVLATKVLASLRYAEDKPAPRGAPPTARPSSLAGHFHERATELRSQTAYGPDGRAVMRPETRARMADRLDPIRTMNPILADRMETLAARRVEFLANKLPRRPDLQALMTGPDRWQPSDMAMRQFARFAAAVEDPGGIEERLASGQVTPEDAEVMRDVYPERYAQIQQEIMMRLPELQKSLPYQRRLSLSIFSGVPVDPAMNPRILSVLQGNFESDEAGGAPGPVAQPQFGSVKKSVPAPTPAQARAGGGVG